MALKIIVPGPWAPRHYLSSTNQGGPVPAPGVPDLLNVGSGGVSVIGIPTSPPLNAKLQAVVAGAPGTATLKASLDGGTNWLGRKDHATWDGNGATDRTAHATGSCIGGAVIDTNSDGVPDTFVAAFFNAGATAIDLYRTTDLEGKSNLSLWVSNIHDGGISIDSSSPAGDFLLHRGTLCLFYKDTTESIVLRRCVDLTTCATWSTAYQLDIDIDVEGGRVLYPRAASLQSGELILSYSLYDAGTGNHQPVVASTVDGYLHSWTAPTVIETAVDAAMVAPVQDPNGKTWFFVQVALTNVIEAYSTTNPAPTEETSFTSETIFTAAAHASPRAICAPNGHLYVLLNTVAAGGNDIVFSYFNGASWAALATVFDATAPQAATSPIVYCVGGALWCIFSYSTGATSRLVLTKYWTTYNVSTAPASWTYPDTVENPALPQFLTPNVWFYVKGDIGSFFGNDIFALGSAATYHPRRLLAGTPRQPCRTTGHNGAWQTVFDLGASVHPGAVDSVAGESNLPELSVDFADTDSWPGTGVTLTATEETIASTGITIGTYTIKRTAGSWEKHCFRGRNCMAYLTTSDYAVPIIDNSADTLFLGGSASGKTGDLRICAPATHETVAGLSSGKRMMRVHAGSTENSYGYYEMRWVVAGLGYTFRSIHCAMAQEDFAHEGTATADGTEVVRVAGPQRRRWVLHAPNVRGAQWKAMSAIIRACAGRPFAFIWDTSDAHAVALVRLQSVNWAGGAESTIVLREV